MQQITMKKKRNKCAIIVSYNEMLKYWKLNLIFYLLSSTVKTYLLETFLLKINMA